MSAARTWTLSAHRFTVAPGARTEPSRSHGRPAGRFSIVPLLLGSRDISAATRRALVENRLRDAAFLLMDEHGLSCIEAGHLLDVPAC